MKKNIFIVSLIVILIIGVFLLKKFNEKKEIYNTTTNINMNIPNIKDEKYILYNFGYDECYYCRQMEPIFQKYSSSYDNIEFKAINIYKDTEMADKYNIVYTPTFIITDLEGNTIEQKVGAMSEESFKKFLEKYN